MNDDVPRSSRFWDGAREYQRLGAALIVVFVAAAYFDGETSVADVVVPLMAMFGGVGSVIYAGAAWVNRSERNPDFQAAVAAREHVRAPTPRPNRPTVVGAPAGEALYPPVAQGRPA